MITRPKTIFMPTFSSHVARNVLRTDVIRTLADNTETRIIVFVPASKLSMHKKEFADLDVLFEGVPDFPQTLNVRDLFFHRLASFYIDTGAARFYRKRFLYYDRNQRVRYAFSLLLLILFGNIKLLRVCARKLDLLLIHDNRLTKYFKKYKPDLVFSANKTSPHDLSFLRYAKKNSIQTVGMIKSWDNISFAKYPFRIIPERIICHNRQIARDVTRYLDVAKEYTYVSGIPHFDFYVTKPRAPRDVFCRRLGIDPSKRIILFASIGMSNPTEGQVATLLNDAIKSGKVSQDVVVIFRYHPSQKHAVEGIPQSKHLIINDSKTLFEDSGLYSEILTNDMEHLADSVHHADVMITTCSTMTIDASALGTPIIDLAFDGYKNLTFYKSVRRFYTKHKTHYVSIAESGATRIAYSFDELLTYLNQYLENPDLDKDKREWIVQEYCHRLDGKAGERIGKYILSLV